MKACIRLAPLLILLALAAFGQQTEPGWWVSVGSAPFCGPPVTGAPYSALETDEKVQTLADGTHITTTLSATKKFRDSAGRTRNEESFPIADAPVTITIIDPVAGLCTR